MLIGNRVHADSRALGHRKSCATSFHSWCKLTLFEQKADLVFWHAEGSDQFSICSYCALDVFECLCLRILTKIMSSWWSVCTLELVNHFTSRAPARYWSLLCMMDETPSAEHRRSSFRHWREHHHSTKLYVLLLHCTALGQDHRSIKW